METNSKNIDVNKCKYRDKYTNFCLAERNKIGDTYILCTGTNCYFKNWQHKEQELTHVKKENERLLKAIIKAQVEIVQKNIDETNILLMKENMDLQQQLKAKEQECGKWKNAYEVKEDALKEAEEYTEELEEKYHKLQEQFKAENEKYKEKLGIIGDVCICSKSPMRCEICPMCYECEELCVNDENLQDIILQIIKEMK